MDWNRAIERQREALTRIVASLVAMAAAGTPTLPRRLHRAVLRLLRPAESAARRLIIALARDLPPPRCAWSPCVQGRIGAASRTSLILPRSRGRGTAEGGGGGARPPLSKLALPLFDPPRQLPWEHRRRPARSGVPRISVPGRGAPFPIAPRRPPMPDDAIDATRLHRRLTALAAALDDLPGEAHRFARRLAFSRHAAGTPDRRCRDGRRRMRWPLRPGRPPGGRKRPAHEIDAVLKDTHWLAQMALERRDTS